MEAWRESGITDYGLPELDPLEYLDWFMFDIGPTRTSGMGESATDWDIIFPYATAKALDAEDTEILADMCKAYYRGREEGNNPLAIEPVERDQ